MCAVYVVGSARIFRYWRSFLLDMLRWSITLVMSSWGVGSAFGSSSNVMTSDGTVNRVRASS